MNRVSTGIPGLDEIIEGGFPESSSILLSGGSGTGKSIFGMQYLYHGAKQSGEPGVYITMEEGPHNLWWNTQRFRWDLLPLEQKNLLRIYKFEPTKENKDDLADQTRKIIEKNSDIRYAVYNLINELRKLKCTTILTCETVGGKNEISRFGVEEFLADGVVQLHFSPPHRYAVVRKMRGTKHDTRVHPLVIGDQGIAINSQEEVLWESVKD